MAAQQRRPKCLTELHSSGGGRAPKIVVGRGSRITIWKPKSAIKFKIQRNFAQDQPKVDEACRKAVAAWNVKEVGVTFAETIDEKEATFLIDYTKGDPGVLAQAFCPDHYDPKKPSTLWIFQESLTNLNYKLDQSMMHELGHVLGLRHEFALKEEKYLPAVQLGNADENSVMTYNYPLKITDDDAKFTKELYEKAEGSAIDGMPIKHNSPKRDP